MPIIITGVANASASSAMGAIMVTLFMPVTGMPVFGSAWTLTRTTWNSINCGRPERPNGKFGKFVLEKSQSRSVRSTKQTKRETGPGAASLWKSRASGPVKNTKQKPNLKLRQKPGIVLEKHPNIRDPVTEHRHSLHTHPEREARVALGVDPAGLENFRMDHAAAEDLEPSGALADATAPP